jgi:hypothetical protein
MERAWSLLRWGCLPRFVFSNRHVGVTLVLLLAWTQRNDFP